jgi:hypothetical protein
MASKRFEEFEAGLIMKALGYRHAEAAISETLNSQFSIHLETCSYVQLPSDQLW